MICAVISKTLMWWRPWRSCGSAKFQTKSVPSVPKKTPPMPSRHASWAPKDSGLGGTISSKCTGEVAVCITRCCHIWRHRMTAGVMRTQASVLVGSATIRTESIPRPPGTPMHRLQRVPRRDSQRFRLQRLGEARMVLSKDNTLSRRVVVRSRENCNVSNIQPRTFFWYRKRRLPVVIFLWSLALAGSCRRHRLVVKLCQFCGKDF